MKTFFQNATTVFYSIVEEQGWDWVWSSPPTSCSACQSDKDHHCNTTFCAVTYSNDGSQAHKPKTYNSVCQFYEDMHDSKDHKSVHIGLGDCFSLFNSDCKLVLCLLFTLILILELDILAYLMTEWFDMDEPCLYGDIEDVLQNLAYVNTYTESSAFRICPKSMRTKVEFQTIFGQPAESMSSQIIGN